MAVVSVLEALLLIGAGVGALMAYRRVMTLVNGIEARQIAPAMAKVNAILDNLKNVSATVKHETERVDHAIRSTIDRVDDTADRMRSQVREKTSRVVGLVRGARVAIETLLEGNGDATVTAPGVSKAKH
jgi:ABC-type transporter Mla subunit MlaD